MGKQADKRRSNPARSLDAGCPAAVRATSRSASDRITKNVANRQLHVNKSGRALAHRSSHVLRLARLWVRPLQNNNIAKHVRLYHRPRPLPARNFYYFILFYFLQILFANTRGSRHSRLRPGNANDPVRPHAGPTISSIHFACHQSSYLLLFFSDLHCSRLFIYFQCFPVLFGLC